MHTSVDGCHKQVYKVLKIYIEQFLKYQTFSFTSTFTLTESAKSNKGPKFQNKAFKSYLLMHTDVDGCHIQVYKV